MLNGTARYSRLILPLSPLLPSPQEALVPASGKWPSETKICVLDMFIASGAPLVPGLLSDRTREDMDVHTQVCTHLPGLLSDRTREYMDVYTPLSVVLYLPTH